MGKSENNGRFHFLGIQNHWGLWLQRWDWKMLAPWKESYDKPRQWFKSRDITLSTKVHLVKAVVFPVVMYGCENWTIKKAERRRHFCTVVLAKSLESPLASKEIKPINLKGNQPWILIGRIDAEPEALVLWLPDVKGQLIGRDPKDGRDWGQ